MQNSDNIDEADDAPQYSGPSKSQLKRESHALQALGKKLVGLSAEKLDSLPLPERLLIAIRETQRTRSHEGLRRQMQYIGKIMRDVDPTEIQKAIDGWEGNSAEETANLHRLERLRLELLAHDDALTSYLQHHPEADGQQLRTLIRNARKEQAAQPPRPPKAFRELFRVLKQQQGKEFTSADSSEHE